MSGRVGSDGGGIRRSSAVGILLLSLVACPEPGECEEDIRAQVLETIVLEVAREPLDAELADESSERDRGWKHRTCDREALLLLPDAPASELSVWGCGLVGAIDVYGVRDGVIISAAVLEPCGEPCGGCPVLGEGELVDAVIETPAETREWVVGDEVRF